VGRNTCPAQQQQRVAATAACFSSRRVSRHQKVSRLTPNSTPTWLQLHTPDRQERIFCVPPAGCWGQLGAHMGAM
jgi:hypothetical protein